MRKYIEEFCEEYEYYFYADYSGRGMFEKRCVGIVCSNMCRCLIELCAYLQTNGVEVDIGELIPVCYDNMGKDMIVYFPEID